MNLSGIFKIFPEVKRPEEKKLGFNVKLKWTLIILASFFVLANIPLFGLSNNALSRFKYLAIILGTDFGSIISLGIGPIVMASVILQLLTGSGILNIDLTTEEGKKFFQGLQKILTFFFIVFEAVIYVTLQGLQAAPGFLPIVIAQLILGGLAIYYMDDVMTKWGFGSGVSLFIAAGVAWRLFSSAFQFIDAQGRDCLLTFTSSNILCPGKVLILFQSVIMQLNTEFLSAAAAIIVTVGIFLAIVWAQSLKVEVPLSFGRVRGYNIKWPLQFFYSSNIPVILTAALIANIQLFGGIVENAAAPCINAVVNATATGASCVGGAKVASFFTFLGHFNSSGTPVSGLAFWMNAPQLLELIIRNSFLPIYLLQGLTHILFFVVLSTLFAVFWVRTSGMDAKSQAHKILSSGLQVSGFRQDERILESILERYILPLTVMGGVAIGLLAAVSDLLGALVSGTAVLLVIMITFQFYQNIAQQHQVDMSPSLRKFIGG
ncbi:MAG TPA: preprotein translocase subunit SecY [Patescibacteria group bacterium]|nr:preprotein translocase subunit SecY [Patescibacteria group bacterium]